MNALIFAIADELKISYDKGTSINNTFLEQIKEKDLEWYQLIKVFISNYHSYFFIRNDKELRIKAKDVWETQKVYFKNAITKDVEKIREKIQNQNMCNIDIEMIDCLLSEL